MGNDGDEKRIKGVDQHCSGSLLLTKYRERCVVSGVTVSVIVITGTEN